MQHHECRHRAAQATKESELANSLSECNRIAWDADRNGGH
jgi:hypothetical protein